MSEIKRITVAIPAADTHEYEIQIGLNSLPGLGNFVRNCIGASGRRVCIISNRKVFGLYGETARQSLLNADFAVSFFLIPDGERHKNLRVLERVLAFFSEQKMTRSDAVVTLGGGVAGDLAGFAAAIFQRGLPFVQVPTTFLAQIDSSVGGKTAVNTIFGKNLIGAFHQPSGVLIDTATLHTLPLRELRAGLFEAVKHSAIANRELFGQTQDFLQKFPPAKFESFFANTDFNVDLQNLIAQNVAFKAQIVAGDEREDVAREDSRSRRVLNFGHTVGHALEKITAYKSFKHGEAVGLGMIAAAEISKTLGKLSQHELNLFSDVVRSVGEFPKVKNIAPEKVIEAFSHDKKAVADSFKWILLEEIGRPAIADNQNIPENIVREAIRAALNF